MTKFTNPVIFLMGPTASGKTALAIELVKHFPCDIISVDSALVYRGMDIGTAKPDKETLLTAPHRLINIREPEQAYSAADFRADALREIQAIHRAKRIPLLVGGTMLYFHALLHGLSDLPEANPAIRQRLLVEAKEKGWELLHQRLKSIDPQAARRIHSNDPQRLQRALEIYELTGEPPSKVQAKTKPALAFPYPVLQLAITPKERSVLHERIAQRFTMLLAQGFVNEVKQLYDKPAIHAELPAMRAVGYRQIWQYLAGEIDEKTMREKAIVATRQLAKRQLTWLRSWPDLVYLDSCNTNILSTVEPIIKTFLNNNAS